MKTYYRLRPSSNQKIIGVYPQVTLSNYQLTDFFHGLDRSRPFEKSDNFDQFKFAEGARVTDFVNCEVINTDKGIVISRKFKDELDRLLQNGITSTNVNAVPMKIDGLEYFLIQLLGGEALIDWKNSVFEDLLQDEDNLVSLSKEEFTPMRYSVTEVKLTEDCDLFQLPFSIGIIISEKLKNLIESLDITGIDKILPFDWFLVK